MKTIPSNIPSSWTWTTMGEIADVVGGSTPRTNDPANYEGGTIPWITPADLSGYTGKYIAHGERYITEKGLSSSSARMMPAGTVLFSSRAPVGYVAIASKSVCTNQGFKSFVLKTQDVIPDYVYWWLKGNKELAESLASGTTFLELSGAKAKQIPIPIAPLRQQVLIVAEIEKQFSRLDEAVASLKRTKANLKRYKAALLKAAVEGKLTEDWRKQHPNVEPASKLLERILAERRAKWVGKGKYKEPTAPDISNLPGLPAKWTWATMPQLGELNRGKSKHRPRNDPRLFGGRYPFIQTGDVKHSGGFIRSHSQTYNEVGLAQSRLWPAGTLCITIAANIAETRILTYPACFPDSVVGFLFDDDAVTVQFVEMFFRTEKDEIARYAPATAQKNINLEILGQIAVPLPPLPEQYQIVVEAERRLSVIEKLDDLVEASLKRSEHFRRSTLVRAFEGKLVPAIPSDEPASVLLEQLRSRKGKAAGETLPIGLAEVVMVKRRVVAQEKQPIIYVLKQANRWLSTAELLAKAGYSTDAAPDEMEAFYLELKKELQAEPRSIEVERRNDFDHFRAS